MAGDNVTISSPSIGGAQPGLSQYILDSSPQLVQIYFRLLGYERHVNEKGDFVWRISKDGLAYNQKCISWLDSKLSQILDKDQKLSRYNSIAEMNREGSLMVRAFIRELNLQLKDFEITKTERMEVLVHLYADTMAQMIRHPLYQNTKDFLGKATSESTVNSRQQITEQTQKQSVLGGLLGGK